jgi:hypothetical protein
MTERLIIAVLLIFSVYVLVYSDFGKNRVVRYDCRDAHWHPDVPVEVKQECQKLMYEEWKKKEDERKNDKSIHENSSNLLRT